MSDDNKDLSEELNDMIGDAKDTARKAGEKISQKTSEIAEDAKELANEAKEKASEFAEDAKAVLNEGKNVAIIAHFWWIGWIIALIMNNSNKTELGSFYVRQMTGLLALSLVSYVLTLASSVVGGIFGLLLFVMWIMSLVGSFSGQKKPVFLLGMQFQNWFKSL